MNEKKEPLVVEVVEVKQLNPRITSKLKPRILWARGTNCGKAPC